MASELSSDKVSDSNDSEVEREDSSPVKKRARGRPSKRGRGRPARGRGKAASRGRPRGSGRRVGAAGRIDLAVQSLEERRIQLEKRIDDLDEEDAKRILKITALRYPSLIFDLLDNVPSGGEGQGHHPPADRPAPSWCVCTRCREMPTDAEKLCCQKQPNDCVSQLPDFAVLILDEAVLALARLHRQEMLVLAEEEDLSKANMHAAYRQFVLWQHGRLGVGIRRVIPSCCVWMIRDKFPDSFGQYTGYRPTRF